MKKRRMMSAITACAVLFGAAAFVPEVKETAVMTANAVEIPERFTTISCDLGDFGSLQCEKYEDHIKLVKFSLRLHRYMPEELVIPSEIDGLPVTVIGSALFQHKSGVESLIIPDTVTLIEKDAFSDMSKLQSVVIPDSVTFVDKHAFEDCTSLTEVTISENTEISGSVFQGTPWLEAKIAENPLVIVNGVLIDGSACEGDVVIPDTVHTIAANAFYSNKTMTAITFPDSLTKIGDYAFADTQLTSVTIPGSVTEIGFYAFYDSLLSEITVPPSVAKIGENAFKDTEFLAKKQKENPLVIINDVLVDGETCTGDVVIPDNVTYISAMAFADVDALTSVVIPEGVTELETHTFQHCDNLTSVTLPEGLERIGSYVFGSCPSLTDINIPDSVVLIERSAFFSCESLQNFHFPKSLQYIDDWAFRSAAVNSVVLPEGVRFIGENAFSKNPKMTELSLPDSLESIGDYAFQECTALTESTIPGNVETIGVSMFSGCAAMTKSVIAEGVEALSYGMFHGCTSMTEVTIPESMKEIEYSIFDECTALTDVYYAGSELDWSGIEIDNSNTPLTSATIHYGREIVISLANLNGDAGIDALDAAMLLTAAAAAGTGADSGLDAAQLDAADLNKDGAFDAKDAALILQYAAYAGAGGDMTIDEYLKQE